MKKSSDMLPQGATFKRCDSRTVLEALLATAAPNNPTPAAEGNRRAAPGLNEDGFRDEGSRRD